MDIPIIIIANRIMCALAWLQLFAWYCSLQIYRLSYTSTAVLFDLKSFGEYISILPPYCNIYILVCTWVGIRRTRTLYNALQRFIRVNVIAFTLFFYQRIYR